jgi:hypothetical protein
MALKDWKKQETGLYKNMTNSYRIRIAYWHYGQGDMASSGCDVFLNSGNGTKKLNKNLISSFPKALKFAKSYMRKH